MRNVSIASLLWMTASLTAAPIARHSPMHPTNSEMVTFLGEASGNIERVRLSYRRTLVSKPAGDAVVYAADELDTELKVCIANPPQAVLRCSFTMTKVFPPGSLVTFTVQSRDAAGKTEVEEYSFAAGDPWPQEAIPIRVKNVNARAFSVVFIPDTDLPVADLRGKLGDEIDLYFRYPDIFDHRQFHNFYYSSKQGHYEMVEPPGANPKCVFTDPPNMSGLRESGANVFAFIHSTARRNCKHRNRFATQIGDDKPLLHESGHAFFGLVDEYCCDSPGYRQEPCVPNLYSSLAACEKDAPSVGFPKTNCVQLTKNGKTILFWRIDPDGSGGCIMGNAEYDPTSIFQKACVRRIEKRYADCVAGACFPKKKCP